MRKSEFICELGFLFLHLCQYTTWIFKEPHHEAPMFFRERLHELGGLLRCQHHRGRGGLRRWWLSLCCIRVFHYIMWYIWKPNEWGMKELGF
jgi:hypothetical protein